MQRPQASRLLDSGLRIQALGVPRIQALGVPRIQALDVPRIQASDVPRIQALEVPRIQALEALEGPDTGLEALDTGLEAWTQASGALGLRYRRPQVAKHTLKVA